MTHYKHIIIVFFLSLGYAFVTAFSGLNAYDEGILLTGGMRVLHDEIPYHDFSGLYPLAGYYFTAFLLFIGNNSLVFVRIIAALIFAGNSTFIYLFAKRISHTSLQPYIAWLLALLWCGLPFISLRAVFIALFLAFASVYLFTSESVSIKKRNIVSYILLIVCSLFRWDIAFYCGIALSLFYSFTNQKNKGIRFILSVTVLSFSALVFPLFFVFILGGENALASAFYQTILFPILDFPSYRQLPIPLFFPRWSGESRGDVILSTFALWGLIFSSLYILYILFRKRTLQTFTDKKPLFFTLLLFTLCLLNQARVRSDFEHHIPALCIGCIFIALLLCKENTRLSFQSFGIIRFSILCLILLIPLPFKIKQLVEIRSYSSFQTTTLSGISYTNTASYDRVITFIKEHTAPNERILICPSEGNTGASCDILLYYATQRLPAIHWHEFHPGITSREDIQEHIIADLQKNKCRFIIRQKTQPSLEPNLSSHTVPSDWLDNYLRKHYHFVQEIDSYTFFALNNEARPH